MFGLDLDWEFLEVSNCEKSNRVKKKLVTSFFVGNHNEIQQKDDTKDIKV